MSVIINGMEMPKEGNWKTVRIYPDGTCVAPNWQGDCKVLPYIAVPLPAGHGRLIDADALYEVAKTRSMGIYGPCNAQCVITGNDILKAPTIVPAEGGADNGRVDFRQGEVAE